MDYNPILFLILTGFLLYFYLITEKKFKNLKPYNANNNTANNILEKKFKDEILISYDKLLKRIETLSNNTRSNEKSIANTNMSLNLLETNLKTQNDAIKNIEDKLKELKKQAYVVESNDNYKYSEI